MGKLIRDQYGNQYAVRTARRAWRCQEAFYGTCVGTGSIEPGQRYLRHVAFPGDVVDVLTVLVECLPCAERHGRPLTAAETPGGAA